MEKEGQGNSLKAETMRYVSLAPFIAALATAVWFAYRAWKQGRGKHLAAILMALLLVSSGYAFLWGIWLEPPTPGCADYALQITSPLDSSTFQTDVIEVRGTLKGTPPQAASWSWSARQAACSPGRKRRR